MWTDAQHIWITDAMRWDIDIAGDQARKRIESREKKGKESIEGMENANTADGPEQGKSREIVMYMSRGQEKNRRHDMEQTLDKAGELIESGEKNAEEDGKEMKSAGATDVSEEGNYY